jgi:hypothetical protein
MKGTFQMAIDLNIRSGYAVLISNPDTSDPTAPTHRGTLFLELGSRWGSPHLQIDITARSEWINGNQWIRLNAGGLRGTMSPNDFSPTREGPEYDGSFGPDCELCIVGWDVQVDPAGAPHLLLVLGQPEPVRGAACAFF